MSDYNGWTNRETWLINLYLSEFFEGTEEEWYDLTTEDMAQHIESTVWELFEDANIPDMFADFIDLGAINYRELAEHYQFEASGGYVFEEA